MIHEISSVKIASRNPVSSYSEKIVYLKIIIHGRKNCEYNILLYINNKIINIIKYFTLFFFSFLLRKEKKKTDRLDRGNIA